MSSESTDAGQPEPTPSGKHHAWQFPPALAVAALLAVWALAVTTLIERRPYGLDEATARAVLFLWSISDQVASPILALGVPDFRALYLIPAGVPFSGSLLAAKLCAAAVLVGAALGLSRWRRGQGDTETALPASSLLLLSPLAIESIDRVAIGPFLLLTIVLGAWADSAYRASRVRFGGLYFVQLLLCLTAVTLHPAGLALPVALAASWWRERGGSDLQSTPVPGRERTHMLVGLAAAAVLGAALAGGWQQQAWFANPVTRPVAAIFAMHVESSTGVALVWLLGGALMVALALVLWSSRAGLRDDRLLATLALATLAALPSADTAYCLLLLVLLLYWGYPLLLRLRLGSGKGFVPQRGVAFVALFALLSAFLAADRDRYDEVRAGAPLSAQDELIQALAAAVQQSHPVDAAASGAPPEARRAPRVASQWPGRTTIACRCSALPLPPGLDDEQAFLANLHGIDFVVFDPKLPGNQGLSQGFARLGGEYAETIVLQPAGVLLRIHAPMASPAAPPALPGGAGAQARG